MRNIFKIYREYRNKKFIEKIDKIYFKKEDNTLFIEGNIVCCGNILTYPSVSLDKVKQIYKKNRLC